MARLSIQPQRLAVHAGLFLAAVAYAVVLVRPITTAAIGRDAAAPVIHFERLIAGRHLEAYLPITSKPLITIVNGVLYEVGRDWRLVAWGEIAAFALCVVLGAVLARRVAGAPAAAFVAVGLLLAPALVDELAFAHAVPWALLTWLIAGLAVTAERPRYAVAGVALAIGATARLEALVVVALALVVLIGLEVRGRLRHRQLPPRGAYLVLLGFLTIPAMLIHDWLLTGDPLLWLKVAQIDSDAAASTVQTPLWVMAWLAGHLLSQAPLLLLAGLGAVVLVRRRCWTLAVGLLALGPGVAAFLVFLAVRHIFFSPRYAETMDLALLVAAGIGLSAVDVPALRVAAVRFVRTSRRAMVASVTAGAIAALAFAPIGVLDATERATVGHQIRLMRDEHQAVGAIRGALAGVPSWRDGTGQLPGGQPRVLVPARLLEQLIVDLDLSELAVARTTPTAIDTTQGGLLVGQIVYHDRLDDSADARYAVLEVDQPTIFGTIRLVPLLADRTNGMWVVRVDAAPGP
jgi:hypothetical protein